ncbi:ROK family protein [Actinospica durhamensis]|uniref:ROK family protein n=1 Tax=Actinospica durhamensis TaxID=1508375 RepID=A0A941EW64_9ACTN|nr:ROK family protein [Actinospica durhamensis]MBR7838381.1 ROK family protein [Actinospica durhamensis]
MAVPGIVDETRGRVLFSANIGWRDTDLAAEVFQRLRTGDTTAHHVWHQAIEALATALAQATNLLAPEVIVIGGGLAQAGEPLLTPLRASLTERLTFQRLPKVVPAQLGDEAGCLGIGLLTLEHILEPPA